ncbi:metallophosphoesterase [Candidatus Woesearchaeota archaeon]|nr:metallophosphoesterase [Candidatus Woesearchaeota archaeon]MBI2130171.1 metallophosphoesterase [Candidatus Woesearchaeota archaeon]
MKLIQGIEAVDLALYVKNTLIIADVHIGIEEAMNRQGIFVPRFQFPDLLKRMKGIFDALKGRKIERIVINGDLKHEFGTISDQEWRHTLKFIDFLSRHCSEILLVKGNHDTILGPIADKRKVKLVESVILGDILICHGDKVPEKIGKHKTIIIGHEHPAVSIRDNIRVETYKCYLVGKYRGKDLIVQPSFNLVTEGTDILKERLLSPFLHKIDDFNVCAVEDKIYDLGKVKSLKPLYNLGHK